MALESIIFDLDQTLVDSSALEPYRRAQRWDVVLGHLNQIVLYPGIAELWQQCRAANLRLAVFTNSPRNVCEAVLAQFGLEANAIVAFGEARFQKPSRDPALRALELMGASHHSTVVIGDRCVDIASGRKANVWRTIGAEWGSADPRGLLLSHPTFTATTVVKAQELVNGLLEPAKYQPWLSEREAATNARFAQELWTGREHDVRRSHVVSGAYPYFFAGEGLRENGIPHTQTCS